jgi:hypothetical protein
VGGPGAGVRVWLALRPGSSLDRRPRRSARTARAQVPFRPVGPPKTGGPGTVTRHFGGRVKGAVGEFEWQPRPGDALHGGGAADATAADAAADTAAAGGAPAGEPAAAAAGGGEGAPAGPAFRPVGLPKSGRQATFSPFPEYAHDPDDPPGAAAAAAARRAAGAAAGRGAGAWRPGGGRRSDATRSIVRMNLKG